MNLLVKNYPNSITARNHVVLLNMGLVYRAANRYRSSGVLFEDLIQIGSIGLIKAAEKFNLETGNKFSSYAVPCIRGEIAHYIRDRKNLVSGGTRSIEAKIKRGEATPEDYQALTNARHCLSLDTPVRCSDEESMAFIDLIPSHYREDVYQLDKESVRFRRCDSEIFPRRAGRNSTQICDATTAETEAAILAAGRLIGRRRSVAKQYGISLSAAAEIYDRLRLCN